MNKEFVMEFLEKHKVKYQEWFEDTFTLGNYSMQDTFLEKTYKLGDSSYFDTIVSKDYDYAYKDLLDRGYKEDDICREDIWAQILFNGKPLILIGEEGESHNLYLKDIEELHVDWQWLEDNGDFYDNNAILQKAIFGEVVYGS